MARTIEEVKADLSAAFNELDTLQGEYAAIEAVKIVNTDLSKPLTDFLKDAESVYLQYKSTYDSDLRSKEHEIRLKNNVIQSLHEEAKEILFLSNDIQRTITELEPK